jgi:transposase
MTKLRPTDRLTSFLMPPSLDEWLPQRHLARFIVEVVDGLDLSAMSKSYRGSGSASYHPAVLLSLLVYGCATGVFSSRKLERATYDSVAFRFITANDHPDHDTIATFRRRFLKEIEALFVKVLLLAREMGVLKMGTVALDGTKIHANASRHSALSYEHAGKIEAQLKAEVADLLAKAEAADQADVPDGMSIPEELERREKRLETLASARATIETRAKERFEREQVEYQAKIAARDATIEATFAFGWRTPSVSECGTGMMRDSSSVRLIWSVGNGPSTGGWSGLPRGFLPVASVFASRAASFTWYSVCSRSKRSLARASIFARATASVASRASRRASSSGIDIPSGISA